MATELFKQEPITDDLVREVTQRIVEAFHPSRVIAFGSYARGEQTSESDLDLIVEMETDKPFYERGLEIAELFCNRRWALDLLVYAPEEFARQKAVLGSLLNSVDREGRVLYGRP